MKKIYQKHPRPQNILGLLITYHPDLELRQRVKIIRPQVGKLLIIDNNSTHDCKQYIRDISSEFDVDFIENEANVGVASALNQGFNYAASFDDKYSWVLTLDQDSICSDTLIEQLISAYNHYPIREQVGIVGTNYKEKTTGRLLHRSTTDNDNWEEVKNLPTSGCITPVSVFSDVGEFRSAFFIDYVDIEYCMRVRRKGYRVLISPKVGMIHPLGYYRSSKLHKLLFGELMVTSYPSLRHYYWTRNGFKLVMENLWSDPRWSLREARYLFVRRIITIILFEDHKVAKLKNIMIGIFDSIRNRGGAKG